MKKKLPVGWEWKRLGQIANYQNGRAFKPEEWGKNGRPIIRIQNLTGSTGEINYYDGHVDDKHIAQPGDVLISWSGSLGVFTWDGPEAAVNQHIFKAIPAPNLVTKEYFVYATREVIGEMAKLTHGSTMKHIVKSDFNKTQIPVPPLETQRKIVAILDKAEETKRLRAQSNELTQKLLQSVFLEMFGDPVKNPKGWKVIPLENLCSDVIDCPHSTPKYLGENRTFPCIRTTELKNGYMDWTEMKYVDESEYIERTKRLIPVDGDIVFGREGTFGEAVRLPKGYRFCLGQRVMLFRPDTNKCNSEFLWALLNSSCIFNQASMKTSGSTVDHVNVKDIKKFQGFCPPIEIQKNFALSLNKIESLRVNQVTSGHLSEKLTQNLFQKAFSGELVA